MKTFPLSAAAATAAAIAYLPHASAQPGVTDTSTSCSCSPTAYSFKLTFDGSCDANSETFKSPGIDGDICFFAEGGDPADIDPDTIFEGGGPSGLRRTLSYIGVDGIRSGEAKEKKEQLKRVLNEVDFTSHVEHAQRHLLANQKEVRYHQSQRRDQAPLDTTPTTITSVTFLEADTSTDLIIINQDSTYFNTRTTSSDGSILDFTSVSSTLDPSLPLADQMDKVPGSVMLVLFGTNSENVIVQNTVAWAYIKDYCDGVPVADGDALGWITLDGFEDPHVDFCEGVTASPSLSPAAAATTTTTTDATTTAAATTEAATTTNEATDIQVETTKLPTQGVFAKSAKKAKSSEDGQQGAKSEKEMSVPTSSKTSKMFKDSKSAKADPYAKSAKAGDDTASSKGTDSSKGSGKRNSEPI